MDFLLSFSLLRLYLAVHSFDELLGHLAGFRAALTRVINSYSVNSGIAKKEKLQLSGEDCREGLTTVLSLKIPDPKFSSQTKDKLVSSEVRPVVEQLVSESLNQWFDESLIKETSLQPIYYPSINKKI